MAEHPETSPGTGRAQGPDAFLADGGRLGALMRAHDWSRTPLGPTGTWPQSLRTMVAACLNSRLLGAVLWGPDLLMLYNDSYAASLGERHPGALGRPIAEVWGDTWRQTAAPFNAALRTGQGFEQRAVELTFVRDGRLQTTWWNIAATPIRGEDGGVVGLFNQGVEITEQVEGERARLRAEEELRALNATLEKRIEERTAALRLHENIVQSHNSPVCRATKLTGQLLAFARRQALQPTVFDAAANTRAITEMISTLVGARVSVELALPDAACFVNADPIQFDTSLVNRAVNARDAMDGAGHLTIRVGLANGIPSVRSATAAVGRFVAVSISDTGCGIPPHHLDTVFEPFFTTKQPGMGTGQVAHAAARGVVLGRNSLRHVGETFRLRRPIGVSSSARRWP